MGNGDVFAEMKQCLGAESIPQNTLNRLVLSGMVQLYEKIEKLQPALTTYKVLVWFVSGISMAVAIALVTGKMQLTITP